MPSLRDMHSACCSAWWAIVAATAGFQTSQPLGNGHVDVLLGECLLDGTSNKDVLLIHALPGGERLVLQVEIGLALESLEPLLEVGLTGKVVIIVGLHKDSLSDRHRRFPPFAHQTKAVPR